ncbi:MAG: Nicotinamide-nucleotide adenylyltransferase [Promethearchaeota archaeon]|nr:MAG: Nicotinamide-nucleotide adenylyltransferase [Candidatus Lokiarchaeota archaeon]
MTRERKSEKEILACIKKEDIQYLQSGQVSKHVFPKERSEAHRKEIPHLIVRLFILSKNDNGDLLFLVQKRSDTKKSYPGYYTDSASGHVIFEKGLNLGTIKKNALRELEEEFGIQSKDVQKITFYDLNNEEDQFTKEVAYIFIGSVDSTVKLEPNPEEVERKESKFYTRKELEKLLQENDLVDYSKKIWNELLDSNLKSYFPQENQKTMSKTKINSKSRIENDQKNADIALFIGRFQPLHHGHIHIINRIFEAHNKLKIGIGSSQLSHTKENPFTKEERKKFIKSALKKRAIPQDRYAIYFIPDLFNAEKWVSHVVSIIGKFDILYSNSDFVRELFKNKGYTIAKKISLFKNKYSGTHIRNLINKQDKQWRLLVPNEVVDLIEKYEGIKRIESFYDQNEEKK